MISVSGHEPPSLLPPGLVDLRLEARRRMASDPSLRKRIGDYEARAWSTIKGITLHQTADKRRDTPHSRWVTLGAHIGVGLAGTIFWVHDLDRVVHHGNGWNNQCVGIELAGCFAGVKGVDRTFWRPKEDPGRVPDQLSEVQAEAARSAIRWVCAQVERHGGQVKFLVAHRQSSKDRRSDPGSEIWQSVALPMHQELGLGDGGHGFAIGDGVPIPESWDSTKKGISY